MNSHKFQQVPVHLDDFTEVPEGKADKQDHDHRGDNQDGRGNPGNSGQVFMNEYDPKTQGAPEEPHDQELFGRP
jgi:hypothetical protein